MMRSAPGIRPLVALVGVLLALAIAAQSAGGAIAPEATPTAQPLTGLTVTLVTFSPVLTSRGITLGLGASCGGAGDRQVTASYAETRGTATLMHSYQGRFSKCALAADGTGGHLVVKWGPTLHMALTLTAAKAPKVEHLRIGKNCYATYVVATLIARGSAGVAIHTPQFGTLRRTRLTAELDRFETPACAFSGLLSGSVSSSSLLFGTGVSGPTRTRLENGRILESLSENNRDLLAENVQGEPSTDSFSEPIRDRVEGSLSSTFGLSVTGGGAFLPAPNLATARLDFNTPVSIGSLTFTAGTGCPVGVRARNGTLSGTVTIHDPVLGAVTFTGTGLGPANLAVLDAETDKCTQSEPDRAARLAWDPGRRPSLLPYPQ